MTKQTEFNLSKRRYCSYDGLDKNGIAEKLSWHYPEEDVKEFIRLLKEKLKYNIVEKEAFISFSEEAFQRDIEKEIDKRVIKQQKDVRKIFQPKVDYDKENDILFITWFPQVDCKFSLETDNGFVFDVDEQENIKGVEIFDFKKRFMKRK